MSYDETRKLFVKDYDIFRKAVNNEFYEFYDFYKDYMVPHVKLFVRNILEIYNDIRKLHPDTTFSSFCYITGCIGVTMNYVTHTEELFRCRLLFEAIKLQMYYTFQDIYMDTMSEKNESIDSLIIKIKKKINNLKEYGLYKYNKKYKTIVKNLNI
jgi:hypothetical protein